MRGRLNFLAVGPLLAAGLVFGTLRYEIPRLGTAPMGGPANADFSQPSPPDQLLAGWQVEQPDAFSEVSVKSDRYGKYLDARPQADGWPVRVSLISQPFVLPKGCSTLSFTARSSTDGDSVEVQLVGASIGHDFGRFSLLPIWHQQVLPVVPALAGQELQLQITLHASAEMGLRNAGQPVCQT